MAQHVAAIAISWNHQASDIWKQASDDKEGRGGR